jgi:hypothetical protein
MRWPVFLLLRLKETFSLSDVASATTGLKDSRRKPFQFALGAILRNSYSGQRLNRSGDLGFPARRRLLSIRGMRPPPDSGACRTALTASCGDKPASGSSRASRRASSRA